MHSYKTYRPNMMYLDVTFPSMLETNIIERAAYSWQELFSNFGGCIGLMTGSSVLSVIEILIYISLVVLEYFY